MTSQQVPQYAADQGDDIIARGAAIGRYIVISLVGRGGMGDVYAAYDPELERKIAVKLLRTKSTAGQNSSEGRARLLREAQAIAKLSHGNVVVVYDVGTLDDAVFIAMEFIEGHTVRYWLHAAARSWREVMKVFLPAGRGLAAAHEAGIVHRDFKPDNVMVGLDGKVRVMDFGLARQTVETTATTGHTDPDTATARAMAAGESLAGAAPATGSPADADADAAAAAGVVSAAVDVNITRVVPRATPANQSPRVTADGLPTQRVLESNLTQTGAMLGTPAYMAPEQFASKAGDARTDQFSFCVSLYESLYGRRPFAGKSFMALMNAVVNGNVEPAPAGTRVPAWIRKILLRGLSPKPEARYPSMTELLDALEQDPSVKRRRWAVAAGTALIAATVALGAGRSLQAKRSPCEGGAAKLAGIWEPGGATSPRKRAIHAAFQATGKSYAGQTFETVSRALEKYTSEWTAVYIDACEATAVRGEQSAEVLDLRMSCLQGRLESVKALTGVFARADGTIVENATSALQSLAPLERCGDVAALRAVVRPPDDPAVRARVQTLKPRLAQIKALTNAGHFSDAQTLARPAADEARAIGYLPLVSEAVGQLAKLSEDQPRKAESLYDDAIWAAQAGGDDELVAEQMIAQSYVIGYLEGDTARARPLLRLADAILHKIGGHDLLRSWLLNNEGALFYVERRYEDSISSEKRALAIKERVLGENASDVAQTFGNLANPLAKIGRVQEALAVNDQAIGIYEKAMGRDHPDLANHLSTRSDLLNNLHRFSEAEAPARRALQIWQRELGPENLFLALPLTALGESYLGRGMPIAARPFLERAYEIRQRLNAEPALLTDTAFALAKSLGHDKGDLPRALTLAGQARDLSEKIHNAEKLKEIEVWLYEHDRGHSPSSPTVSFIQPVKSPRRP
jgi:serine/threonine protein kinase/tetratricopeptide (TPR) repeat protein